jgi:hypothetical protein
MFTGYLELQETLPRTAALRQLLNECPYNEVDEEDAYTGKKGGTKKYTWEDLRCRVQASDQQLRNALCKLNAFEWKGHWRLLSRPFAKELFDRIIITAHANEWPLSAIPLKACQKQLSSYPDKIIEHCLKMYSHSQASTPEIIALDPTLLCAMRAEDILLENPDRVWLLCDFMAKWKDLVQNDDISLSPTMEMLKGVALISSLGTEKRVIYLPIGSVLPPTAPLRFAFLFMKQRKWTLRDITPYIEYVGTLWNQAPLWRNCS